MEISVTVIKELRDQSGAGIMECRNVLAETEGNVEKALEILRERNIAKAEKKMTRVATQGLVEAYIHVGGRIGAMLELSCETDFVARTDEFKGLAHQLAMQVAAMAPLYVSPEEIPEGSDLEPETACLMLQSFIKDPNTKVKDVIAGMIAKVGENIKVRRFARFELGTD